MVADADSVRAAASAALGVDLSWAGPALRGSDRASVRRAVTSAGERVVVKAYDPARMGEGFVREAAALSLLAASPSPVLRLRAAGPQPPLVVTDDLGSGPCLADALLGSDPAAALTAVEAWGIAVARVQTAVDAGAAGGPRTAYVEALRQYAGDLPVDPETTSADLELGIARVREQLPALGLADPTDAWAELLAVPARLAGGPVGLSPGDTCPDNNVGTADGLVLIDFEGASVRPVAWDAAYLLVPWPTCWCCWALPPEVSTAGLAAWRSALPPEADHPGLDEDIVLAAAAWSVATTGWFLPNALGTDPPPEDPRLLGLVPARRALILHRLRGTLDRDHASIPALAGFAADLLDVLERRWGRIHLRPAPAFR